MLVAGQPFDETPPRQQPGLAVGSSAPFSGSAMSDTPSSADHIRTHLARVAYLREQARTQGLTGAVTRLKQVQACRFRGTYQDVLADPRQAGAARFFLDELYGARDFSERDRQFSRIAGAIERLFPEDIGQLACDLSDLHALTESLDLAMAAHWQAQDDRTWDATRYLLAWRLTGQPGARQRQLRMVRHLGDELQRLTRRTSLRVALRMMRRPAEAAGLGALQHFLEQGFDAFALLGDARAFLQSIEERESSWLLLLDQGSEADASRQLADALRLGEQGL